MPDGSLFVLSGPSGAGKSSITRLLLVRTPGLLFSVSHTTRPRRPEEKDGREYRFIDDARFRAMIEAGEFLEWAEVHGKLYGTARRGVDEAVAGGRDLLLDIDVQGAAQIRQKRPDSISIFILPPDFATLRQRLAARGTDDDEQMARRLGIARSELTEFRHYEYLVINSDLETAADEVRAIVIAGRRRGRRMEAEAERILATFPDAPGGRGAGGGR